MWLKDVEFEFRYEDLKRYIQFNSFCRQVHVWMLLKLTEKIIQEKAFEQKKKKPRLNLTQVKVARLDFLGGIPPKFEH